LTLYDNDDEQEQQQQQIYIRDLVILEQEVWVLMTMQRCNTTYIMRSLVLLCTKLAVQSFWSSSETKFPFNDIYNWAQLGYSRASLCRSLKLKLGNLGLLVDIAQTHRGWCCCCSSSSAHEIQRVVGCHI
jgi:hypothetical protein